MGDNIEREGERERDAKRKKDKGMPKMLCLGCELLVCPLPVRVQAFENTLKSWEDKLKYDKLPLRPHLYSQQSVDLATEEEVALVQLVARAADELITRYTQIRDHLISLHSTLLSVLYLEYCTCTNPLSISSQNSAL